MYAREWKTRCPKHQKDGFIRYLYQTGIRETAMTDGFLGAQIMVRDWQDSSEVTLITFWDNLECIKAFAGEDISIARLYPEDEVFELDPDPFVFHYEVVEHTYI
ncbi:antibiotic biosynthesis monooxygenase [Parasalinivibrio latis]|uniref:antibiotic biosynthesis monooxygenase n=1 Tax=Parasalinivibrio latis TaxID=2952610 RepID=UPI0030E23FEE